MKKVIRQKSQGIVSAFLKEDIKKIVASTITDLVVAAKKSEISLKKFSLKDSALDLKNQVQDTALLIKILPQRFNDAFQLFAQGFLREFEKIPDNKERTVFCMKVLAALSKNAFSTAYSVGTSDATRLLSFGKSKKGLSQLVMSRLLYKSTQTFLVRFLEEMEKDITDPEELKNIELFKEVILDDKGNAIDKFFDGVVDPTDPAYALVENFRNYIFTGEL